MAETWTDGDPYEGYVGRWSRLLAPRFLDAAGVPEKGRALDVGCGTGALSEALLARGLDVRGVDPSAAYVAHAARTLPKARFDVGDAQRLAFPDGQPDGSSPLVARAWTVRGTA